MRASILPSGDVSCRLSVCYAGVVEVELQQTGRPEPPPRRAHGRPRLPPLLAVACGLHLIWGAVVLLLLVMYVAFWEELARYRGSNLTFVLFFWIAFGAANMLAGVWLAKRKRAAPWVAALCSLLMLCRGLADTVRGDADAGTVLLHYVFPIVSLAAVFAYRRAFVE